jgi:hypothetical protein
MKKYELENKIRNLELKVDINIKINQKFREIVECLDIVTDYFFNKEGAALNTKKYLMKSEAKEFKKGLHDAYYTSKNNFKRFESLITIWEKECK